MREEIEKRDEKIKLLVQLLGTTVVGLIQPSIYDNGDIKIVIHRYELYQIRLDADYFLKTKVSCIAKMIVDDYRVFIMSDYFNGGLLI